MGITEKTPERYWIDGPLSRSGTRSWTPVVPTDCHRGMSAGRIVGFPGRGVRRPVRVLTWLGWVILAATAVMFALWIVEQPYIGWDRDVLLGGVQRWLNGGSPYPAFQLAGPFATKDVAVPAWLYPPPALLLFAPFLVLPAVAWWAIPAAVLAWSIWRAGPTGRALIALCLAYPGTWISVQWGNATMLFAVLVALAVRYPTGPWMLLKPTLLPFAAIDVRRRAWWLSLAVLAGVSVAFGGLWVEWWISTRNLVENGLTYSLPQYPMLMIPLLARLRFSGKERPADRVVLRA